MRVEPKSEQTAVISSDSEVYEASHFVFKLFMQSVNAAVWADTSPRVFDDDRNPVFCSLLSSLNPSQEGHAALSPHVHVCAKWAYAPARVQ